MSVLLTMLGVLGCSETPVIQGKVLDIWNKPVSGAMIQMEGSGESQTSNSKGEFSFSVTEEKDKNIRFRAGSEGYIHDVEIIVFSTDSTKDEQPSVTFNLYPEPESKGFHAIGSSEYITLPGKSTKRVATKLEAYHGLSDIGNVSLQSNQQQLVFYSSLRKEEIQQIDLALHEIIFKEEEEVKGVLGETPIEIDLWLAQGKKHQFGLRSLDQEHMYLIEFPEPLEKGVYAFHSGSYLTSADPRKEDTLPAELKVAYPFEVK